MPSQQSKYPHWIHIQIPLCHIFLPIWQPDYHAQNQEHWKMLLGLFHLEGKQTHLSHSDLLSSHYNTAIEFFVWETFASKVSAHPLWPGHSWGLDICCWLLVFVFYNHFFGWNCDQCTSIIFQHMNYNMTTKMQIHAQIGHCHAKNQLEIHHRTPSSCPKQMQHNPWG